MQGTTQTIPAQIFVHIAFAQSVEPFNAARLTYIETIGKIAIVGEFIVRQSEVRLLANCLDVIEEAHGVVAVLFANLLALLPTGFGIA